MSPTDLCNAWADRWVAFMLAAVWQSTLWALVIAAVAYILRFASPAVRYGLWQIVALKLLVMPLWTWPLPADWATQAGLVTPEIPAASSAADHRAVDPAEPAPSAETDSLDPSVAAEPPPAVDPSASPSSLRRLSWVAWLMLGWCAVVVLQAALVVGQWLRLRRFLSRASPAGAEVVALAADWARKIELRRMPRIVLSPDECPPFVCGLLRPTLVLPPSLEALLPGAAAAPVLVHELAHLKRRDLWWNWLPQAARTLYWFHPIAHWVVFRTRLESELACDGWALAVTGQPAAGYADLLVRLVSQWSRPALLGAAAAVSAGLDGPPSLSESEVTP